MRSNGFPGTIDNLLTDLDSLSQMMRRSDCSPKTVKMDALEGPAIQTPPGMTILSP
jgi:hypothetical protein